MHTEKVLITPQIARMFLERNTNNRSVRPTVVSRYAADMQKGQFLLMPHGIVFLKDGTLADGQHRLLAIVKSNVSQEMMVTHGADPEIQLHQDRLAARKEHDNLFIGGHEWADATTVAIIKLAIQKDRSTKTVQTSDIVNADRRLIDCAVFMRKSMPTNRKYLTTAPIMAAIALALYTNESISRSRIIEFCSVVYSGFVESDADSAAIVLRNYLLNEGAKLSRGDHDREQSMIVVQSCLIHFLNKKTIRRLPKADALIWPKVAKA